MSDDSLRLKLAEFAPDSEPVDAVEGIGASVKKKLNKVGVRTTNDLICRALRAKDRKRLSSEASLSPSKLYKWAGMASLMRVKGIGAEYAEFLSKAGVKNLGQLANQTSGVVRKRMERVEAENPKAFDRTPSEKTLSLWINQGKSLFENLGLGELGMENIASPTLKELDFKIHDFLKYENWDSLVDLGGLLQGLSISKIQECRRTQKRWEGLASPDAPADLSQIQKMLGDPQSLKAITARLAGMGRSEEDINKTIENLKKVTSSENLVQAPSAYYLFVKSRCNFAAFVGALGFYLAAAGRFNNYIKTAKESLTTILESEIKSLEGADLPAPEKSAAAAAAGSATAEYESYARSLAALEKETEQAEKETNGILETLYDCLTGRKPEKLEQAAAVGLWRLRDICERLLLASRRTYATVSGSAGMPIKAMRLATRLSTLLEKQTVLYAACSYFEGTTSYPSAGVPKLLEEEIDRASKSVCKSEALKRDFVPISELLAKPKDFRGSVIQTCGTVEMTPEWRKSETPGFILRHAGKRVNVIMKGLERRDGLPPEDSFTLVSGTLRNSDKGPTIEARKLDSGSAAKRGWIDQMAGDFWYSGTFEVASDRFLRFPETARWMIKTHYGKGE